MHLISPVPSTDFFSSDGSMKCVFEIGAMNAVKHASSFPLTFHAIHVSEAGIVGALFQRDGPFGVIFGGFPLVFRFELNLKDISDIVGDCLVSAPGKLTWSTPGFSENFGMEHQGKTVFKD